MECEFCKKTYSCKSALKYHQKNTRACLEIQGNLREGFLCKHCNKTFATTLNLKRHDQICRFKVITRENREKEERHQWQLAGKDRQLAEKDDYIRKLEKTIQSLQDKLENIAIKGATKATSVTNNTHNNNVNIFDKMLPFTEEIMAERAKSLTTENVACIENFAEFTANDMIRTDAYVTDIARGKVIIKGQDESKIVDMNMNMAMATISKAIKDIGRKRVSEKLEMLLNSDDHDENDKSFLALSTVQSVINVGADSIWHPQFTKVLFPYLLPSNPRYNGSNSRCNGSNSRCNGSNSRCNGSNSRCNGSTPLIDNKEDMFVVESDIESDTEDEEYILPDDMKEISKEYLSKQIKSKLTKEYVYDYIPGLVRFVFEHLVKHRVVCTDLENLTVMYKNDGAVVTDVGCIKLSLMIFKVISTKYFAISNRFVNKIKGGLEDDELIDEEYKKVKDMKEVQFLILPETRRKFVDKSGYSEFVGGLCKKLV